MDFFRSVRVPLILTIWSSFIGKTIQNPELDARY